MKIFIGALIFIIYFNLIEGSDRSPKAQKKPRRKPQRHLPDHPVNRYETEIHHRKIESNFPDNIITIQHAMERQARMEDSTRFGNRQYYTPFHHSDTNPQNPLIQDTHAVKPNFQENSPIHPSSYVRADQQTSSSINTLPPIDFNKFPPNFFGGTSGSSWNPNEN